MIAKCFLANRSVMNLPPHSPDLAPGGFFVFPKVESVLKGEGTRASSSKKNVTAEINAVCWDAFREFCASFRKMQNMCSVRGPYFKENKSVLLT